MADVDAFAIPGGDAMVGVWAWEDEAAGRLRARIFPNGIGIDEDEATGAAAIQFGALLGRDVVIRQGEGSELHARPGRRRHGRRRRPRGARLRAQLRAGGRGLTSSPPSMVETVAILCGGRGTRLAGELPKPLVEVGGLPIVWHVASIFAAQGVRRVVLLTGYRAALVAEWAARAAWPAGVAVTCVDTGEDTPTGGRVLAAAEAIGPGRFFLTYGDGVADVALAEPARRP